MIKKYEVGKDYHGTRFDKWFKINVLDIPQGLIEKITRKNLIKVNNKRTKSSYRVQENDEVLVYNFEKLKKPKKKSIEQYKPSQSEKKKYDDFTIENNENFIVINKPSGIPVQSGTKSFKNIIDILRNTKYFENTKPFIVHRLDKETSGILIIAKNREYAQLFTSLFRIRKIHKTYLAVTQGEISSDIKTLEGFTEGLIHGISASSLFWMGVDPTGISEIDDIAALNCLVFLKTSEGNPWMLSRFGSA